MIYIDTNVIVYSYINPDDSKHEVSKQLIEKLIIEDNLILSPLIIQELVFVLHKLKVKKEEILEIYKFFKEYSKNNLSVKMVKEACKLCFDTDSLKKINDAVHLKFAERHASKLVTFDNDFKKFKEHTPIEIEILPV